MANIDELLGEIEKPKISNLTVLILGKPKTGKSTFAASSASDNEKTIMLNIEKGLAFIQETENLRIYPNKEKACTKTDLDKLYNALKTDGHNYKNIVFDTADELWNILVDDYLKAIRVKRPNQEGIELQDYTPMYEKYQKTINAFKNLGLNVFLTAHTKRFEDDPKQVIALPGKLGGLIGGSVDMILHLTAKTTNGKMETILYTQPNVLLDAGHRHFGVALPEKMINPVWSDIPKILEKGIKETPKTVKQNKKDSEKPIAKPVRSEILKDEDPNKDYAEHETGVPGQDPEIIPAVETTEDIYNSLTPATTEVTRENKPQFCGVKCTESQQGYCSSENCIKGKAPVHVQKEETKKPEVKIPTDPVEIRKGFMEFCKSKGLVKFDDLAAFGKKYGFKSEEPECLAQWLYEMPDKLEITIKEFITENKKAA